MEIIGELPLPLLHVMRDIRMKELEEQNRDMQSSGPAPASAGGPPFVGGDVDELLEDLS